MNFKIGNDIEALERKVAEGGRRLKRLLLAAEELHAKSQELHRELSGVRSENADRKADRLDLDLLRPGSLTEADAR